MAAAAPSAPVLELHDLGVWYRMTRRRGASLKEVILHGGWARGSKALWALRHITLTCREGEVLGVVGRNGAGKSTLCLVMSQILVPDEGRIAVRGKISALLTLGAGFVKDLSGRANILTQAAFLGLPRRAIAPRMEEIIDFSELGDFIDEPMRAYSSGMRARLAFAIASTVNPDILLLDEVLSVGDLAFRNKCQKRLEEMMGRSRLIIVVSHSTSFIRQTCSHCLWLEQGRARAWGPASEVVDQYEADAAGVGSATADANGP